MKVLIVLEVIPDKTYACVYNMSNELYKRLSQAHGYTVNNSPEYRKEAEEAVLAMLHGFSIDPEHEKCCVTSLDKELFMKLTDMAGTEQIRNITEVEAFIHCAYML